MYLHIHTHGRFVSGRCAFLWFLCGVFVCGCNWDANLHFYLSAAGILIIMLSRPPDAIKLPTFSCVCRSLPGDMGGTP